MDDLNQTGTIENYSLENFYRKNEPIGFLLNPKEANRKLIGSG